MNKRIIILFTLAIMLIIIAVFSLNNDLMSPYTGFTESMEEPGQFVQVFGTLDKTVPVQFTEAGFTFALLDEKKVSMNVEHSGPKPNNFEHADSVVLQGSYDDSKKVFVAQKVLIKCPSKYKKAGPEGGVSIKN